MLEVTSQEKIIIHQEHDYFSIMSSAYVEPHNFQVAWNHKYSEEHEVWSTSTQKEFNDMIHKGVWRKPKIKNTPPNI